MYCQVYVLLVSNPDPDPGSPPDSQKRPMVLPCLILKLEPLNLHHDPKELPIPHITLNRILAVK